MTINIHSVKLARTKSTIKVNGEELIERLNAALEDAPIKEQYDAIKGIIASNREVAALKKTLGITEYLSTHQARWLMINAFNEDEGTEEE